MKNMNDIIKLKKEYERMAKTCQGLISTIQQFANFMDAIALEDKDSMLYVEYKNYSDGIKKVLIDNGWVKVKND